MLSQFGHTFLDTLRDVLPVVVFIVIFQLVILRQPTPRPWRLVTGCVWVVIGLTLFLVGLEQALFPIGRHMAQQLSAPEFVFGTSEPPQAHHWGDYAWTYVFGALIGFSTTIAEPALIAVALKANQITGGTVSQFGLRVAVALGVAIGVAIGTFRIVTGFPIIFFLAGGYLILMIQTVFAPRAIIPLAYDSGGVTTSTVTVPVLTALGLGLSAGIPGRNPAVEGFGLIAFASLFPMMTVMGYAQFVEAYGRFHRRPIEEE